MKYLKVKLWGREIGRLVWEQTTRRTYFMFNPDPNVKIPDFAPMMKAANNRNLYIPIYGDDRPIYQGLPTFIADSLPDSWGNTLFDKWVRDNKIPRNKVTPLYKLMFIGTRGMGALEYEPFAAELNHNRTVDIKSLYDLSLKILEDRENTVLDADEGLTLQALLAVGTSAGGRQMKAIIAINPETGEIRSGQTAGLEGYESYILKFGNRSMPMAEIETAYHRMAVSAGINMEECRLLHIDGTNHFLTKRFDRNGNKKIHVLTLAAMEPEAKSYEGLIETCRTLSITESEISDIYARMVFNVLANNTDDHNKNFSFMLEEGGEWKISPAYDVTFIFNTLGTGPNIERRLSVRGKTSNISMSDLLDFAKEYDIKNANCIIERVAKSIAKFDEYAEECQVTQPWRGIVRKTLMDNLKNFGYLDKTENPCQPLYDKYGREITGFSISVNSKGYYEVDAAIDGHRHRRFIRPNMNLYSELRERDIYNLDDSDKIRLVENLFPLTGL